MLYVLMKHMNMNQSHMTQLVYMKVRSLYLVFLDIESIKTQSNVARTKVNIARPQFNLIKSFDTDNMTVIFLTVVL